MHNVNTKQILALILASSLLMSIAGCNKKPSEEAESAESTSSSESAPALYQEGVEAYQSGKFDVAAAKFRELAEQGDSSAQFNLGSLYRQG